MAKNRKFKTQYLVTIEGTTSNGFQAKLFDDILRSLSAAIGINSQQTAVDIKVLENTGDYDVEKRQTREETK